MRGIPTPHPLPQGTLSTASGIHLAGGKTVQIGYPVDLSCPRSCFAYELTTFARLTSYGEVDPLELPFRTWMCGFSEYLEIAIFKCVKRAKAGCSKPVSNFKNQNRAGRDRRRIHLPAAPPQNGLSCPEIYESRKR